MLSIDFTVQDVARVRLVESYGPLTETVLSLGALGRTSPSHLRPWGAATWRQMSGAQRAMAVYLRPGFGTVGVDLITLTGPALSFHDARDALLEGSLEDFALESALFRRLPQCESPAFVGAAQGDPRTRRLLVSLLAELYEDAVAPVWSDARARLAGAYADLGRRLTDEGVQGLFGAVGSGSTWDGSSLTLPTAGQWSDTPLAAPLSGRGLTVVPSYFATTPEPYFPIDTTQPAVLFVPVPRSQIDPTGRSGNELLGRTRSAVLRALAVRPRTTGELAADLGLSASTASEHATILRQSGLVVTTRSSGRALHACTPLGRALVRSLRA